jgi:hypothetical protein|tara:strand:+ start:1270 stop:1581 length:312 start_codon:yes stop_codon:yes gene_type:complete
MGQKAWFISDRSGFRFRYADRVKEPGTGYIVGPGESDGAYNLVSSPLNKSPKITSREILKDARPDRVVMMTSVVANLNEARIALGLTSVTPDDIWVPSDTIVT